MTVEHLILRSRENGALIKPVITLSSKIHFNTTVDTNVDIDASGDKIERVGVNVSVYTAGNRIRKKSESKCSAGSFE